MNNNKFTPIYWAKINKNDEIVAILELYQVSMLIVILQDLFVYYYLDAETLRDLCDYNF
jgi:hypothetical protein